MITIDLHTVLTLARAIWAQAGVIKVSNQSIGRVTRTVLLVQTNEPWAFSSVTDFRADVEKRTNGRCTVSVCQ